MTRALLILVALLASAPATASARPETLVFTRGEGDAREIYTAKTDGSNVRRLTRNRVGEYGPRWSPDGTRIVFERAGPLGGSLYTMRVDGTGVRRVTRAARRADGAPVFDSLPDWSPDGKRLVFSRGIGGWYQLYVVRADGTRVRRITRTERGRFDLGPRWSPDGKWIVFGSDRARYYNSNLWRVRPDGSDLKRLTRTKGGIGRTGDDGGASWSPNGGRIAFISNRNEGSPEVFVMRADGTRQRPLTSTFGIDEGPPAWTADGRRLVFSRRGFNTPAELYRIDLDGTGERHLFRGDEPHLRP